MSNQHYQQRNHKKHTLHLPKRIILLRHGESAGNLDNSAYTKIPDPQIPLTPAGLAQARLAGTNLRHLISRSSSSSHWRVHFYVSPYLRTRSTLREIGRSFSKRRVIGVREECRVREQDFGNFQVEEGMKVIKETRERYGRFFYRFPEGESAADVFDRVSNFLESLWRDIEMNRLHHDHSHDLSLIIISHGLTSRVFLMKWFKWTVEQFELLNNPGNCEFRVLELGSGGEYSLAIHHTEEEMREWGLDSEMIADQKLRAHGNRGAWDDNCPCYLDTFFDPLADSDDNEYGDSDDKTPSDASSLQSFGVTLFCNFKWEKTTLFAGANKPKTTYRSLEGC
ncbi:hypothetical protein I3842_08G168200 [Carya illinoinensis]|uniref:Uncharacterized protein n=1 Tax=Carya illinoinensis TaxID=32201 RepID=A0A922JEK0_CARIL|nr:hypothetical protein I3842_08G168200 [Carya illinoinensis]